MLKKLYDYVNDIVIGKIPSCLEIKQAVQRFQDDLKRTDIIFDKQKASNAIIFISHLKHSTGKHNNKRFYLEGWQIFIVANIFGWYYVDSDLRRFNDVYIEVSRKNGKTALAAAISLYTLVADGEASAEVILSANSREQARLCFDAVSKFSRKLDLKQDYLRIYRNEVKHFDNIIKIVASDVTTLDGLNASTVIIDEYHSAKTTEVYDVLKSSQGMREQPLFIIITTAGTSKTSPCYQLRKTAKEILSGLKEDDRHFITIYTLDEEDDYRNSNNWIKANPNLNITVKPTFLKKEINNAQNNVSAETGVLTKHFNIWVDTLETWIANSYILDSCKELTFDDIPEDAELICGVDLSSNSDITAVSYMWVQDDKYYFINKYYLPEDSLNSATDKLFYRQQYKEGNLILTPDNVVDYTYILDDIIRVHNQHYIHKLTYDSWNATQFIVLANQYGLRTIPYSQTIANFNRPTKQFERLALKKNIYMDSNAISVYMFQNVYMRIDSNGNVKPDKSKRSAKIDGVISMLMCLGEYLNNPTLTLQII